MNNPNTLWLASVRIVLAAQFLCPGAALHGVPSSRRVSEEKADQPAYVPQPFTAGLSGDYRGSEHSEESQQKLYLQETPAGLLFELSAFEPHPKRELSAGHSGTAKKVAEGVFAQEWESEDEEGNPVPAWFYIAIEPSGKVEVRIRGTVARNPPFHTARNLEGTYHKVGPEAKSFDRSSIEAVTLLKPKLHPQPSDTQAPDDFKPDLRS